MKRLIVLAVLLVGVPVTAVPSGAAPRACPGGWGSVEEVAGPDTSPNSPIEAVRTGRHGCYDRFVVDLGGPAPGYAVRYVNRYRAEASGAVIPLPGGARIEIIARAPAVDSEGDPTFSAPVGRPLPGVRVTGYDTFRSLRYGGSFEGLTSFGLGVRARLPFRVLKVGDRLVVDVAHNW